MIAVDVNDVADLYDTGVQVLNDNLGPEATFAFMNLSFRGRGDYTAEKQARPPRTDAEMREMKALIMEEARQLGRL